ncbi:unnamed protein product [Sphagnum troendelagicum]|uniref:LOB domain-containing protein n=1 Tax=Sphagnum troendelagicum TaxID=128251 RepID=A0ABP0TGU2_9BRYO
MSCNGCRVLRKGCSDTCILRPCLQWIDSPDAQGHATVFVAKFFGRAGLMGFISAVPEPQRPALFQSLLYEACGRTVNPVFGSVGLLWSGNWQTCQAAVETVLRGSSLQAPAPSSLNASCFLTSTPGLQAPFPGRVPQLHALNDMEGWNMQMPNINSAHRETKVEDDASYGPPISAQRAPRRVKSKISPERDVQTATIDVEQLELDLTLKVKSNTARGALQVRRQHPPCPTFKRKLLSPCESVSSEGSVTSLDSSTHHSLWGNWPSLHTNSLECKPHYKLLSLLP